MDIVHPWQYLQQRLKEKGRTQKDFARLLGKKVSEVNELIKGKRNITVQWDILLSTLFGDEEQKWCRLQLAYDYYRWQQNFDQKKIDAIKVAREEKVWKTEIWKDGHEDQDSTARNLDTAIKIENGESRINESDRISPNFDKQKEDEIFRNF